MGNIHITNNGGGIYSYYKIKACCEVCANYRMITTTPKIVGGGDMFKITIVFACGDDGKDLPENYCCDDFEPGELLESL